MKIEGSGSESGSISQRHGSADSDADPDPQQNVMDPEHLPALKAGCQRQGDHRCVSTPCV
jgi:hypothetical protein